MSTEQLEKFQEIVEIPTGVKVTLKKHMVHFEGPLGLSLIHI
jgi:ribosomal protein L6P/L9E